ncbi:MAG TPA: hypothetical protein VNJ11_07380 [Bryobacteraceae bacterium]|nr:hypothetical protein [Bryobacteraceae bacterium]
MPETAIYWCSVCKRPERFLAGQQFPPCPNLCGRGRWELVRLEPPASEQH